MGYKNINNKGAKMGRYYHGDIEGKFWVAVQSSGDADFFGVEGTYHYLDYYFEKKDCYCLLNSFICKFLFIWSN